MNNERVLLSEKCADIPVDCDEEDSREVVGKVVREIGGGRGILPWMALPEECGGPAGTGPEKITSF